MKALDKQYLDLWNKYKENVRKSTPIDFFETDIAKKERIKRLESDPEAWFKYYFPNFYTSEPAPFHLEATKRVLENPEWYEVRSWSRELSKSGRTMMEVLYLAMQGKKKNVLMVSSNFENATRLLLPYKSILEYNARLINDYGEQQSLGNWEAAEFITRSGVSFRALGAGQSPRGTRKDEMRPDTILIDDIDTDEECRNEDRINKKIKWIEEALIPTRSISNPLLLVACGNIIAKRCCITELGKMADTWDIINIRDEHGKSTWPTKNSEAAIDRVLSKISHNSAQKEYFNNPVEEGTVFKELYFDEVPPIQHCSIVLAYADPSTSNKDKGGGSYKSIVIAGYLNTKYYVYRVYLDKTSNSKFVDNLFDAYKFLIDNHVDTKILYIENNSLQDPFYQQVIMPLINERARVYNINLPLMPDARQKPDKFFRIEGTLEPLNRNQQLIFDINIKNTQDMKVFESQMLAVSSSAKYMDGPDALEGAIWLIQDKNNSNSYMYSFGARASSKY